MFALKRALSQSIRKLQQPLSHSKHTLPELPYAYDALEPIICRDIMILHHQKHHQAYVTNLNATEEKLKSALECGNVSAAIALEPALRFNGGGHINHSIFWQNLSPNCCEPSANFLKLVERSFGNIDTMKELLTAAAMGVQGSGWAWLGFDKRTKMLRVVPLPNQDPLEASTGLIPFFGIDVWEHAYYLQYKNVRADYVKSIFDITNWKYMSDLTEELKIC